MSKKPKLRMGRTHSQVMKLLALPSYCGEDEYMEARGNLLKGMPIPALCQELLDCGVGAKINRFHSATEWECWLPPGTNPEDPRITKIMQKLVPEGEWTETHKSAQGTMKVLKPKGGSDGM